MGELVCEPNCSIASYHMAVYHFLVAKHIKLLYITYYMRSKPLFKFMVLG